MNERIKELDKQARIWAIDNTNFPISSNIPSGYTQKLVELVVLECISVHEDDYGGDIIGRVLKEHFGIEK